MSRMIRLFAVAVLLSAGHSPALEWNFNTAQPASVGWWTSLELDSSGYPHMSYRMENGQDLSYVCWDGSAWQTTIVDMEGDAGLWSSLELDSSNYPHISYMYKNGSDYDLKYAHENSSGWQIETVDPAGSVGWCTSLALDSSDYPHISYRDNSNFNLKYARWDGSGWQIETVDDTGMVGLWSSIAIDSFDHPHISYMDYGNGALKYARWDGSSWHIETVDYDSDPTVSIGFNTSIALDSGDLPHISYVWYKEIQEPPDPIDANSLKYARWNGSNWQIEFVDESQGDNDLVGFWNSIVIDSFDYPHISYGRNSPDNKDLRYARWDGSGWQIEFVYTGIALKGTSIKLDDSDNPRIACVRSGSTLYFIWSGTVFHLLWPASGETITTTEPTLDWEDCNLPCFVSYTLWWGTDPNFSDYNEVTGITGSDYQITEGIEEGDTIYWRVKSIYSAREYWADETDWHFNVGSSGIDMIDFTAESTGEGIAVTWYIESNSLSSLLLLRSENEGEPAVLRTEEQLHISTTEYLDSEVSSGIEYRYWLEVTETDGTMSCFGPTEAVSADLVQELILHAIYPNPSREIINFAFSLPEEGRVNLTVYDLSGRCIASPVNSSMTAGHHEISLSCSEIPPGVYFCHLESGFDCIARRLIIIH